tara:strand:- start:118 stop:444 length:327 start_codon:yes stop_codon:yes gene_type:complete
MTFRFLPDAFYASKHQPWLDEAKYGNTFDNEKDKKKRDDHEAENKYNKDRMMHGKKKVGQSKDSETYRTWKKRRAEMETQKPRMTEKGVKFYDKKGTGYIKGGKKKYD